MATTPRSELADLDDEEFLDELQENLAADDFGAFLADDVVSRTRSALIDLKNRTVALSQLTDEAELVKRRRRFVILVDSRISRATVAMKDANRRRGNEDRIVQFADFAERLCREIRNSNREHALDFIEMAPGFTARQWLEIREENKRV